MKRHFAAILIAGTLLGTPAAADEALVGATIIDGTGGPAIENGVVVVHEGSIKCVGTRAQCRIPKRATVHDLGGSFVTPGLIDSHVHFDQTGWIDGRPDGIEDKTVYPYEETIAALRADPGRWHRSYLCSGVTAVFDVGGAPWTVTGAQATDTERPDRAHVKAAGPLITHAEPNRFFAYGSLADQPVFLPMQSVEQVREDVARLKTLGSAAVKVWYLDPDPGDKQRLDALLMEAGAGARNAGLPLIVHATELENAKTALRAGARMLVHSVEDEPIDQEFLDLLAANDAIYAPTLVVGRQWTRAVFSVASGEAATVDDPNRCVDQPLLDRIAAPERLQQALEQRTGGKVTRLAERFEAIGRESLIMAGNLRKVRDAGGRIVLGTDAGNPLTVHGPSVYWEMEAMQAAGLSPQEVFHAATIEGARTMGLADRVGSLEPGKVADLLVLAEDPRKDVKAFRSLTHVMRAGVLRSQEEMRVR